MLDFIRDNSLSPIHRLLHKILPGSLLADHKITSFWTWFTANEDRYFHFEDNQHALFALLNSRLKKIDRNLAFEFAPSSTKNASLSSHAMALHLRQSPSLRSQMQNQHCQSGT
jgi:hypothetical protein